MEPWFAIGWLPLQRVAIIAMQGTASIPEIGTS